MTAWFFGWILYVAIALATVFDGAISFVVQALVGIWVSGLSLAGGFILGFIFRIPVLGRWWRASWSWAAGLAMVTANRWIAEGSQKA